MSLIECIIYFEISADRRAPAFRVHGKVHQEQRAVLLRIVSDVPNVCNSLGYVYRARSTFVSTYNDVFIYWQSYLTSSLKLVSVLDLVREAIAS